MDWDDLRYLLEVMDCGSLTTAARRLGVNQSTVGRRLEALENALQVRLLQRGRYGVLPTAAAQAIRERVERINAEIRAIEGEVGGLDLRLEGTVTLVAPVVLARRLIAPYAASLCTRHRGLTIDIRCYGRAPDRHDRGPAVLLQWKRFDEPDLIVRRVSTVPFGLFAARSYVAQNGYPDLSDGCDGHMFIAPSDNDVGNWECWVAQCMSRARTVLRTDSLETQLAATVGGAGISLLPHFMAEGCVSLVEAKTFPPPPAAEIWLGVRPEYRAIPRVRLVIDYITECLVRRMHAQPNDSEPARDALRVLAGLEPVQMAGGREQT